MFVKKQLIIAGGGFSGVTLARELLKAAPERFDITLIDRNDYQLFYPALFKAATGPVDPSVAFEVSAIKFKDIFAGQNIKIIKGELAEVMPEQNKINLKPRGSSRPKLNYDYLVLALGSESKIQGLKLLSFEDALSLKNTLEEIFKTKAKHREINIVVVGGGLTGCELMAYLVRYGRKLADEFGHPQESLHFKLAEAGTTILPSASSWVRKKAGEYLGSLGVKIMLNTRLGDADKESADLLVWTVGAKPSFLLEQVPEGTGNIFITEAPTAQEAIRQGKYLAKVLKCIAIKKRRPRYKKGKSIYVAEFDGNIAFADLGFIKLQGRWAKWLHLVAFLRYFTGVLSFNKAVAWLKKYNNL
jgi:NADH:ubiquinone reductase (H+-translocating)